MTTCSKMTPGVHHHGGRWMFFGWTAPLDSSLHQCWFTVWRHRLVWSSVSGLSDSCVTLHTRLYISGVSDNFAPAAWTSDFEEQDEFVAPEPPVNTCSVWLSGLNCVWLKVCSETTELLADALAVLVSPGLLWGPWREPGLYSFLLWYHNKWSSPGLDRHHRHYPQHNAHCCF